MRIGIVIGRIGGVDGVALEAEKWITVLRRLGHEVRVLTGELEAELPDCTVVPELAFSHPDAVRDQRDAFFEQTAAEGALVGRLRVGAGRIREELLAWIRTEGVEVLLPENATTLPFHLTMGMALVDVLEETRMPGVAHDHDFRWERGDRYATRYPEVADLVERCFPPRLETLRHAVINTHAQRELRDRCGLESLVVPNVMDFEAPFARRDGYNEGMLEDLGIPGDALCLFQVTRIVRRKGIETAVELVARLDDPRVHLVVTGRANDDFSEGYLAELEVQAAEAGVAERVHFAGERFDNVRRVDDQGRKVYSLEDAYARADAMTYFSTYEGFGNAFVEACLARVPVLVNEYLPVYPEDIGSKGFRTVALRDEELTDAAVAEARRWLESPALREEVAEENFALARRHFSYAVLAERLGTLLEG